jgi:serine/threonine-protein kinase HipA
MSRRGKVFVKGTYAGSIEETNEGLFVFEYDADYIAGGGQQISMTMPTSTTRYTAKMLFPFFDGLIPEGWLLHLATKNWKINPRDRMGLLLTACRDCIGAVHVEPFE